MEVPMHPVLAVAGRAAGAVALWLLLLVAASAAHANPYAGYSSATYGGTSRWLCHPQLASWNDSCRGHLDAIAVEASGAWSIRESRPATDARVDCFYVYPTASTDLGANSDFFPGDQEKQTTLMQAGRYREVCRMFAPVYRQRTLTYLALDALADSLVSDETAARAAELAYADVRDAFRHYVAQHNQGRGFLLIGHSQGSRLLSRLIAEEIEKQPYLAQRLIAAHLPGFSVLAPKGADAGGTFATTPACRHAAQTGCVVAYSAFRQGDPELATPRFGVSPDPALQALCVNPAALAGGSAVLEPHMPFAMPPAFALLLKPRGSGGPYASALHNALILKSYTPFFTVPGQVSGQCVVNTAGTSYLEVRIAADPADPRADDYPGELQIVTGWGLHLIDINLAAGNLVKLARSQSQAWLARQ
jgi:hypothetical protein